MANEESSGFSLLTRTLSFLEGELAELTKKRQLLHDSYTAQLKPVEEQISRLEVALNLQRKALAALKPGVDSVTMVSTGTSTTVGHLGLRLTDVAEEVLREVKVPLHYKRILDELTKKGVFISARDPGAFVISYLSREPSRFCRTAEKGKYALVEWGLSDSVQIIRADRKVKKRKPRASRTPRRAAR